MEKNREVESSSSVATVEDIQKRLIRPSLNSQPCCDRINSQFTSKLRVNSRSFLKKMQVTGIHKLEDYLDPIILSAARAKISGNRKNCYGAETKKTTKSQVHEFDLFRWPGEGDHHELNSLTSGSTATGMSGVKQPDGNDAIDLSKD